MASNFNNEIEPWKYSLDIDNSGLHLTLDVHSSSSTHVEPSLVTIIPGPSGVVQLFSSTHVEPSTTTLNPVNNTQSLWVSATNYVNAFSGTVTGSLGDVDNFLKKGKLEQVVGIVKSCSPNMLGDLNVTLKDLSGTIPGTIHYKVIGKGGYGKDINVGATMILKNVSVFTPKASKYYLNIKMQNVVEVFRKDTVPGSGSG
ncbi:hypothetical protein Tco_0365795 [Tanacetum coccineum]